MEKKIEQKNFGRASWIFIGGHLEFSMQFSGRNFHVIPQQWSFDIKFQIQIQIFIRLL